MLIRVVELQIKERFEGASGGILEGFVELFFNFGCVLIGLELIVALPGCTHANILDGTC